MSEAKMKNNKHIGSSFESFLEEEGILEEVTAIAVKRVIAYYSRKCMKRKLLNLSLLSISLLMAMAAHAKIHFDVALLRGTNLTFQNAVTLTVGQKPAKVYQDETAYIEAELVSEAEDMPHVKLTVSTKSDHGMFLVRGMPEVVANIASGLSMSSVQCNSANDNFALLVAMAKTE